MLKANILALGDAPPLQRFDAWEADRIEREIFALAAQGCEVPLECIEAWTAARSAARELHDEGGLPLMASPLFQSMAVRNVNGLRPAVEAGDGGAVLEAVSKCAAHALVLPGWLAAAFVLRVDKVHAGDEGSWDAPEIFGRAIPAGMNRNGVYGRQQVAPQAYSAALGLLQRDPDRPIDRCFYEDVGREVGRSGGSAEQLILEYVAASDGVWPPLGELKAMLPRADGDVAWAACMWSDNKRRAEWLSAGGTSEEWVAAFGGLPSGIQPKSSGELSGRQA